MRTQGADGNGRKGVMADLSNLLGDVYGDDPDGEAVAQEPAARDRTPDWADESVLDAAFANWVPGPPPDAPAAERAVFESRPANPASAAPLPDDLAAALSAALVDAPPAELAAPAPRVEPAEPTNPVPELDQPVPSWSDLAEARRAMVDHPDPFAGAAPLVGHLPWQRGDDDILPRKSSSRRGRPNLSITLRRK
jgi:hypothetical protein